MKKCKEILIGVLLLSMVFFTACTSNAAKAMEMVELGQKYLTELNYTEAVASFTEAIGLDPENISAYMGRAEVYELTDETTSAESDYSVAIDLLDEDDIRKKEDIADTIIRELKIKVLQLHAEICIRLGL